MPLNHSAARKLALLLYDEPLVRVTELKRIADDTYRIRFTDPARRTHPHHPGAGPDRRVARLDRGRPGAAAHLWGLRGLRLAPLRARPQR
jgi:hypothetical protein